MALWLQIYSNLVTHPKTYALADELGITSSSVAPNVMTAGMLVSLWSWALNNSTNGDITSCPPRALADGRGVAQKAYNVAGCTG